MSIKLSTLIVNGSPFDLDRVATDSNQRDRQLLIKAITLELDGSTRTSNKSELVEFLKIEKKLTCVIRYLTKRDALAQFAEQIQVPQQQLLSLAQELDLPEDEEHKEPKQREEQRRLLLTQMKIFLTDYVENQKKSSRSASHGKVDEVSEQESDEFPSPSFENMQGNMQKRRRLTMNYSVEFKKSQNFDLAKFWVNGEVFYYVHRSLFLFGSENRFRQALVHMIESRWFDDIIMIVIVLNSISIASFDHSLSNKNLEVVLKYLSYMFAAIYLFEALARIIACGFAFGRNTYLRKPTNVIDFIIVLSSLGEIVISIFAGDIKKAIKVFRVLRVFRVFKLLSAFYKIPQMRQQLRTLGRAFTGILNVLLFLGTFFVFLAIIGLQLFSDDIYNACRLTKEPVEIGGKRVWQRAPTEGLSPGGICNKSKYSVTLGGFKCPQQYTCGSYLDYGMPLEDDGVQFNAQLFYNVAIWKHFGSSLLAVFQIVTTDTWGDHMYNLISASNFVAPVLFCFFIHMAGTYYIMNLMIVVIMESYIQSNEIFAQDDIEQQEKQIKQIEETLPDRYKETSTIIKDFIRSPNFNDFMEIYQPPKKTQTETKTEANEQLVSPEKRQKPENSMISIKEPEIEDRLAIEMATNNPLDGIDFASSQNSDTSESDLELVMNDIPDYLLIKLKELYDFLSKIENLENRKSFINFMVKTVAAASLTDVDQKYTAQRLIDMELDLLKLKFEKELQERYKNQHEIKYGLKQERKVLSIISQSVKGMFDLFASRQIPLKEKIRLLQGSIHCSSMDINSQDHSKQEHSINQQNSMLQVFSSGGGSPIKSMLSHKSSIKNELYVIRKKARLELRDQIILTLNHMHIVQSDIKVTLQNQDNFADFAAHDLVTLSQQIDDLNQREYDQIVQLRVLHSNLYQICLKIEQHWLFQTFISLSIMANFVVLAIETYPSDPTSDVRKETSNIVFFFVFMMEMVIKMIGNGPIIYFQNSFNKFDFIVIAISLIDLIINNINLSGAVSLQAIRALRVFRLLRMFKLAKFWKSFNELLNLLFETTKKIFYLTCIMILFWLTYAILGKELFAFKMSFVDSDYPVIDDFDFTLQKQIQGSPPDFNFNTFITSANSVFIFFLDDGWNAILNDAFRMPGINRFLTILFFFTLYIGGNMVICQLFRTILLREFDQRSILQKVERDRQALENKRNPTLLARVSNNIQGVFVGQNKVRPWFGETTLDRAQIQSEQSISQRQTTKPWYQKNRSLFIFSKKNKIRKLVKTTEKYKVGNIIMLDAVIYLAIGISSLLPALQSPFSNSRSKLSKTLYWLDAVMTILFTIEVIIKIISKGLVLNGPKSYLRKPSNILDFLVVLASLTSQFISNADYSFVKVLRIITRLARPLKLLFRDEKLKISIQVLIAVLPEIFRLLTIYFLFCLIFATISVNLLAGRMYYCDSDHLIDAEKIMQQNVLNAEDCFNLGGVWKRRYRNFDNIWSAFIQMFTMTQGVGWRYNLLDVMQSTGVNQQLRITPPYKSGSILSLFIVVWMIVGYFFIKNLFVGVVIAGYNRQSEKTGASISLTEEQRKLLETELLTFRLKPLFRHQRPQNKFRACFYNMIHMEDAQKKKHALETKKKEKKAPKQTDLNFEIFISCVILLNALILILKWPNMSSFVQLTVDIISYICTGIYIIEATIKLIAYGKAYFGEGWNVFDFLIVIGSLIFITPRFRKERVVITFIKTIKLLRVLSMFDKFKKIKIFYAAITKTMMSMFNVGLLMLLIIYIFAIIGVQIFGPVKLNGPMTQLYNFQNVPKACLTLYRMMTRDHWNLLLEALSLTNTDDQPCIVNPNYEDYIANGKQAIGCGKPRQAVLYIFTFSFILSVIFLSLFIAIILQAYFQVNDSHKDMQVAAMITQFQIEWSQFDPQATGVLEDKDLEKLMFKLGEPLGWHERHRFDHKLIAHFKVKIADKMPLHRRDPKGQWYFEEVLDQLLFYYLVHLEVKQEMLNAKIKFEQNSIMKRTRLKSPKSLDPLKLKNLPLDDEMTPPSEASNEQNSPVKTVRSSSPVKTVRSGSFVKTVRSGRTIKSVRSAQSVKKSQRSDRSFPGLIFE